MARSLWLKFNSFLLSSSQPRKSYWSLGSWDKVKLFWKVLRSEGAENGNITIEDETTLLTLKANEWPRWRALQNCASPSLAVLQVNGLGRQPDLPERIPVPPTRRLCWITSCKAPGENLHQEPRQTENLRRGTEKETVGQQVSFKLCWVPQGNRQSTLLGE